MSQDRIRLFVALELGEQAREALLQWRAETLPAKAGLRLVASEYLHVTLCFLGSRPAVEADEIVGACSEVVAAAAGPPELELGPATWLPTRRPRVLAVDLMDRTAALGTIQRALSERLADGGWYEPEERPFRPHVTVARVPRSARTRAVTLASPPPIHFAAGSITLFRSRVSRSGARYEALSRFGP